MNGIALRGLLVALLILGCLADSALAAEDGPATKRLDGKKVVIIIAPKNFRDEELLVPRSLLEDAGAEVTVASTTTAVCTGMLGGEVRPHCLLQDIQPADYDAVILVGGQGAAVYFDDRAAHALVRTAVKEQKLVGAICIAPVILARAGVLEGRTATVCGREQKQELQRLGAKVTDRHVVCERLVITADGPAASQEFGQMLVRGLSDYLPLAAGYAYTYRVVTPEGKKGSRTCHVMARKIGKLQSHYFRDATAGDALAGVFPWQGALVEGAHAIFGLEAARVDHLEREVTKDDFQLFLVLPLQVGHRTKVTLGEARQQYVVTVKAFETVEVPAGTFADCARIEMAVAGTTAAESHFWLAPGVGMVKWERGTGETEELTDYSIGGGR